MASVEKISIALPPVWRQAVEDNSPGIAPEEVLDRLEQKYQLMADAAGARECE